MPDSVMDNLGIGAGSPEVMPELDCKLNVCAATDHTANPKCRFHGDHSTVLGEKIRQQRAGDTGIPESMCTEPVKAGFIRVYIAGGQICNPIPAQKEWSKSGHTFAILDIPVEDFERYVAARKEWDEIQRRLRKLREETKCYCSCGSDHANLPASYD